jgi:chitin deacetylase
MYLCSTEDWSIASGGTTSAAVSKNLQKWFHGPKSPGIIILEHEVCPLQPHRTHL